LSGRESFCCPEWGDACGDEIGDAILLLVKFFTATKLMGGISVDDSLSELDTGFEVGNGFVLGVLTACFSEPSFGVSVVGVMLRELLLVVIVSTVRVCGDEICFGEESRFLEGEEFIIEI
jgi:hypothetical protein